MSDSVNHPPIDPGGGDIPPEDRFPYNRRFIRRRVRLKLDVQAARSYHAWTHNLSEDGLCFEIPDKLEEGREITIWIFIDREAGLDPVQARCRVIWHDPTDHGTRHGGKFLFFADDGSQRLKTWLKSNDR
jgi:hypothetical protein